jgi:hypothetical protein
MFSKLILYNPRLGRARPFGGFARSWRRVLCVHSIVVTAPTERVVAASDPRGAVAQAQGQDLSDRRRRGSEVPYISGLPFGRSWSAQRTSLG